MNIPRFILMLEEYNNCKVKEHYYLINEFNEDEHVFMLETGEEISIKEPNKGVNK